VDFPELFRQLHRIGYDRYVIIEREISGEQQRIDIKDSKIYLENLIKEIYG
jgi:sugar phosphate isomerase/epimerase